MPQNASEKDQELVALAKKIMKEAKGYRSNGVAIHVRQGCILSITTGPCHGFIRNAGSPDSLAIVTLINRADNVYDGSRKQPSKKVCVRYLDFIFNRSPWAECFTEKDASKAWEDRCVVMSTSAPANLLQGALMTTRHTWEKVPRVELWYKLVNLGVNERHAFLAMNFACAEDGSVFLSALSSDHSPVGSEGITVDGVKSFMTKPPSDKLSLPYNQGGSYVGVKAMWETGSKRLQDLFHKDFEDACKEPLSAVVLNPFLKAKPQAKKAARMSVERYAAFVTKYFNELTSE